MVTSLTAKCALCGGDLDRPLFTSGDVNYGLPGSYSVRKCGACGVLQTCGAEGGRTAESADGCQRYLPYEHRPLSPLHRLKEPLKRFVAKQEYGYGRRSWYARAVSKPLARLFPVLPACVENGLLLDVGCGTADHLVFCRRLGWRVEGVEPSAQGAAIARTMIDRVYEASVEELELPEEGYDCVRMCSVLEHLASPASALKRVSRWLRPGGQLILIMPNPESWAARAFGAHWFHWDLPRHRFHYTRSTLEKVVGDCGFLVERSFFKQSYSGLPYSLRNRFALGGRWILPMMALIGVPHRIASEFLNRGDEIVLLGRKPGGTAELRRGA